MDLKKRIKKGVKEGKVVMGYDRVIKMVKSGDAEVVVYSNNITQEKLENLLHNSKISGVDVEEFLGDNVSLGLFCGKPFSVSVLAIKGNEK